MKRVTLGRVGPSWSCCALLSLAGAALFGLSAETYAVPSLSKAEIEARLPPALRGKVILTKYTPEQMEKMAPPGPNPMLAFLPVGAEIDYGYWKQRAELLGRERAAFIRATSASPSTVSEHEPNDSFRRADRIRRFGTRRGQTRQIQITGSVDLAPTASIAAGPEDEGSITLATPTGLTTGSGIVASGVIGDGPFGSAGTGSGDFDFFEIANVAEGQLLSFAVNTPEPFDGLDPFIVLYNEAGEIIASNDDGGPGFDSALDIEAPADGTYYLSIGSFFSFSLEDPFDSSSGPGVGSEGTYDVEIGLDRFDDDFFSFRLRPGDIISASLDGISVPIRLIDRHQQERIGSAQDASSVYPAASPLLGGGSSVLAYVIDERGRYAIQVRGVAEGTYTLTLQVDEPPLLSQPIGSRQTIFIDFDGATLDDGRVLSPLSAFLEGWGLTADDEDAVIDAIMGHVIESLEDDIRARGLNGDFDRSQRRGDFDIEIQNSRDDPDPFGQPNTSRVIVGGTIEELGIPTLGIADSIDPGNFERSEGAFVLLDLLSAPASNPNSLNQYPRAPGVSIIDVVGAGVGNITAHEAGHYLGNFHTENFVTPPNIMDRGGNLANLVGVGDDGIFGTEDDVDVDFGIDIFVPIEGFTGFEDTLNVISFGAPTPRRR